MPGRWRRGGGAPGALRRRWAASLCAALLVLAACTAASEAGPTPSSLRVVTTINVIADFASEVGGTRVWVSSIVPLGVDPHTYEPTPSDARLVSEADLVLRNGLGLERWLDRLVDAVAPDVVVTVTDGLPTIVDDQLGEVDPHLWMDPVAVLGYLERIGAALAAADPEGAEEYTRNAGAYSEVLRDLHDRIGATVATLPVERRKLVTTHDAFRYFGDRYGLEVVGTIWGISTEREPSAEEVRRLVDAVREHRVPVVFVETTVDPRLMERVARDAGVRIGDPLYGDSLGAPGSGADTYVGMMETNVGRIVDGLRGDADAPGR